MQILVKKDNFHAVVKSISLKSRISLDTETTGLYPFHGDRLFSIIIADDTNEYYFDFNLGGLPRSFIKEMQSIFDSVDYIFFINYEYDCTMLRFEDLKITKARIMDCGVMARLENSSHNPPKNFFSMDYLAKYYINKNKDKTVDNYIKENNLFGVDYFGKKKPLFNNVSLDKMFKYGCSDARLTFEIAEEIISRINDKDEIYSGIMGKLKEESDLSKCLVETKLLGITLDTEFVEKARAHELSEYERLSEHIRTSYEVNINSPKQIKEFILEKLKLPLPLRVVRGKETTSYRTDAETLISLSEKYQIPELNSIVEAKRALKKANTYYKNFLKLKDKNNIIHCGLGQDTTVTGRFSSYNPNLQNLTKEKYHEYAVRNSFICREDYNFFFLDYKGQEMYLMIDISGDKGVIDSVNAGEDIYISMALMVEKYAGIRITRSEAKALSLGVAYGQGIDLISSNLKCSKSQALELKNSFLNALSGVRALDDWCKRQAKCFHKIRNVYGRVTLIDSGFEYKALNALIQGTAADCTKRAFINCFEYLEPHKSNILLSVHDELIFEIHKSEFHLVEDLKKIMSEAYPHRYLGLNVEVEYSETSWGAKKPFNF